MSDKSKVAGDLFKIRVFFFGQFCLPNISNKYPRCLIAPLTLMVLYAIGSLMIS